MIISTAKLIVDADACPKGALEILIRLSQEYGTTLITVSSFNHHINSPCHITVGDGKDEADFAVVNRVEPGDIVLTQDWGLAALVLGRKGRAVSFKGREYTSDNIDFMLDERYKKAKVRRGGGRTKGPQARSKDDDVSFEKRMRAMLCES